MTETHIGCEEEDDAIGGTLQSQATDEKDGQHNVGQSGGDVHSLWGTVWGRGDTTWIGQSSDKERGLIQNATFFPLPGSP